MNINFNCRFHLTKDGTLFHTNHTVTISKIEISSKSPTTKYCVDGVHNYGDNQPYRNLEHQSVLFLCVADDYEGTSDENISLGF